MNGLTPALQTAQHAASPRWGLQLRVADRSTVWNQGGDSWEEVDAFPDALAAWNPQSIAAEAANGGVGILRVFASWDDGLLACQYVPSTQLGESSSWQSPALLPITSHASTGTLYTPKPALLYENGRWHCFYRLPGGGITLRTSSNNGATWSAPQSVYSGAVVGDLFAAYSGDANLHLLQFHTQGSVVQLQGASRLGHSGAWQIWPAHATLQEWQPAGVVVTGALAVEQLIFARAAGPFVHSTARYAATLNADGTLAGRATAATLLWSVTGDGALRPRKQAAGRGLGGLLLTMHDSGAGRAYPCVAGLHAQSLRMEEPIVLSDQPLSTTPLEGHLAPLEGGLETWLVGLTKVFRSVHRWHDQTVGEEEIIAYRFDQSGDAGGLLQIELRRGSDAEFCMPGCGLWLTRSCIAGDPAVGGGVTLGLRVERVERHAAFLRVVARDALGMLAAMEARRPLQIGAAGESLAQAVALLVGWAGLRLEAEVTLEGAPAPFQWLGGESGLSALRRLLKGQAVLLRSRVGAAGDAPAIWIGPPPAAAGEAYGAYGNAQRHPLVRSVQVEDGAAARLAVVHGWAVRNSPLNGEAWALALSSRAQARPSPMVRPQPLYLLNRNLAAAEQLEVAANLRLALDARLRAGWIEAQAQLALEPFDWIRVDEEDRRVAAIHERWQRGRLVQRIELAP